MSGPDLSPDASAAPLLLELSNASNMLRLGPDAQLFIQQLVLTGLVQQPLPTSPSISSALPLAAVAPPPGTDLAQGAPYVWLHNVTLVLPPEDYLALASLALANRADDISRCLDAGTAARAAALQTRIRDVSVSAVDAAIQWLALSSFTGWGVKATNTRLIPASSTPSFADCSLKSDKGTSASSSQCGRLSCPQLVGVVIGSVLGCAILLAAAFLVKGWFAKAKAAAYPDDTPDKPNMLSKDAQCGDSVPIIIGSDPTSALASRLSSILGSAYGSSHSDPGAMSPDTSSSQTTCRLNPNTLVQQAAAQMGGEANQVTITGVIGQGSYGCVFRGIWRGLDVAVKTVVFEDATDDKSGSNPHTRAIMEAAIAASVGHPNLVCTYHHDIKAVQESDAESAGGLKVVVAASGGDSGGASSHGRPQAYKLFLVQELCEISLASGLEGQLLAPLHDIEIQQCILLVLRDIALGLEYLHSKSIIHGDLKPDNILLKINESGSPFVITKLADFGLSTHLAGNATHVSNLRCGTPFYVAPEVIVQGQASLASDMFSFGVVMWQCLTNQAPFVHTDATKRVWHEDFPNLRGTDCFLWTACQGLMKRCLQFKAQHRPTAAVVVKELNLILVGMKQCQAM